MPNSIDPLTGLKNAQAMEEALKQAKFPKLIVVDIAAFGAFNATHGTEAGDRALVEFTRTMEQFAKAQGLEVYRIKKDEFAFLQDSPFELEAFEELIFALTNTITDKRYAIEGVAIDVSLGAHIGITLERGDMLDKGYKALRYSQKTGRPFTAYSEFLRQELERLEKEE